MKFNELRKYLLKYPIFTIGDILKWFSETNYQTLKVELNKWVEKGFLKKIKRGLFWFSEIEIKDNFYFVEKILPPSYITLETALNYYSIIPDVPQTVTCVTPLTTRKFNTPFGVYFYRHIKKEYFFGFRTIYSEDKKFFYNIALPEKALLDFIYFNLKRLKDIESFQEERFSFDKNFAWNRFLEMSLIFTNKKINQIAKEIRKKYEPR